MGMGEKLGWAAGGRDETRRGEGGEIRGLAGARCRGRKGEEGCQVRSGQAGRQACSRPICMDTYHLKRGRLGISGWHREPFWGLGNVGKGQEPGGLSDFALFLLLFSSFFLFFCVEKWHKDT